MSATATETFEFAVGDTATLDLHNRAGGSTIAAGPAGQIRVVATKRAHGGVFGIGGGDPERVRVVARQDGDTVVLDVDYGPAGLVKNVTVDFEITVPAATHVILQQNAGDARLSGTTGRLDATVNAGNLTAEGITLAGSSRARINAGHLEIQAALAGDPSLDAETNAGNIRLTIPAGASATLDARTTAGSIHTTGLDVSSSGGFVGQHVSGAFGPHPTGAIRLKTTAGSITITAE